MILDGKKVAGQIQEDIKNKISSLKRRAPGLAFVLVGKNPASQSYVRAKQKACLITGIISTLIELPSSISQANLVETIKELNLDSQIDGILVQLPLPSHINAPDIMLSIDPQKDVDGFHPINMGKTLLGQEGGFFPCTPYGIQVLLEKSDIPVEGKKVVIVGRSNIVGKPLAAILMQKKTHCNATVTIAHSQSENLTEITRSANILVAAIGSPLFIKKEMVSPQTVVIDVGINRVEGTRLVGDVDFKEIVQIASHITPVPGGVGPMTIAMLLQNTLTAHTRSV
jgi:methylenetetrahydrofolate dehydrogenase (NADP+)/methenyltetrahydrofolate cyclohydrolase